MRDVMKFLPSMGRVLAAWALAGLAIGAVAHVQAQDKAPVPAPALSGAPPAAADQPDTTTASYGDWVLQCQREAAQAAGPSCELRQTVVAEGQRPIAQLAIARLSAQAPMKLAVVLPTHVSFAEAPRVAAAAAGAAGAGGEAAISLVWRRCLPMGCFADGDLSDAVLRQWRAQAQAPLQAKPPAPEQAQTPAPSPAGRLVFQDGSDRAIVLPVSFRGLGEALDALIRK